MSHKEKSTCAICHRTFPQKELFPIELLRQPMLERILKDMPDCQLNGLICQDDMHTCRAAYIEDILEEEKGQLSRLEQEVIDSFREHDLLSENMNEEFEAGINFGQKLSDRIANFGGSWKFISLFFSVLVIWMGINILRFTGEHFDPYPFILLNLVLSCLAAIQAPIIMMSQNRQAAKERLKLDHQYAVNLKAELQIRQLHSKIDQLMREQWTRMLAMQQIQIDLLEQIQKK